jgi:hypothetical protein
LPFNVEERLQDEIHTLSFEGTILPEEIRSFGSRLVDAFKSGCAFLIVDLEKIESIHEKLIDFLYQLNLRLTSNGASFTVVRSQGDIPKFRAGTENLSLLVEDNRHVALGGMVSVMSAKKEILSLLSVAENLVYSSQADDSRREYSATFVRNLQNFLIIAPGDDYDTELQKGYRLLFSFQVPPMLSPDDNEKELPARIIRFDALIEKYAAVKGEETPSFVLKCPTSIEIEELRGEKSLPTELKMSFWGSSGDRTPTAAILTAIDTEQLQFRVSRMKHSRGAELFVDIDFQVFKFSQPQRVRIIDEEHDSAGLVVTAEFIQLSGGDFGRLEDYLNQYC